MTVTVSSKQFVPRDTNKLALLKTSAPDYQIRNVELFRPMVRQPWVYFK